MQNNQSVRKVNKRLHTPETLACLQQMRAAIHGDEARKMGQIAREVNAEMGAGAGSLLARKRAWQPKTEVQMQAALLTPNQRDGLEQMQELCLQMMKLQDCVNTAIVNYELDLPRLFLVEISYFLQAVDLRVNRAKVAARRLGVQAVQPKVKLAVAHKVLGLPHKTKQVA